MKYKIGDKVKVRKDLEPGNFYGRVYYSSDMNKFKAMECVVTNIYDGTYNINNSEYGFSDEMLEPVDDLLEYALEKLGMTEEELKKLTINSKEYKGIIERLRVAARSGLNKVTIIDMSDKVRNRLEKEGLTVIHEHKLLFDQLMSYDTISW